MINLVALPCLCVDVFDGTDELRAGGEALNFAVHASKLRASPPARNSSVPSKTSTQRHGSATKFIILVPP